MFLLFVSRTIAHVVKQLDVTFTDNLISSCPTQLSRQCCMK